jgi:hypothetical protein
MQVQEKYNNKALKEITNNELHNLHSSLNETMEDAH